MGTSTSRVDFRVIVKRLASVEVAEDDALWTRVWGMGLSVPDVWECLQPSDVRRILCAHPRNLALLVRHAVRLRAGSTCIVAACAGARVRVHRALPVSCCVCVCVCVHDVSWCLSMSSLKGTFCRWA